MDKDYYITPPKIDVYTKTEVIGPLDAFFADTVEAEQTQSNLYYYSTAKHGFDSHPVNVTSSEDEFFLWLESKSKLVVESKAKLGGIQPVQWMHNAPSKAEQYALSRYAIYLDLDDNPDIQKVLDTFSDVKYFCFTTYNHQVSNSDPKKNLVNRLRLIIPFKTKCYSKEQWAKWIKPTIKHWLEVTKGCTADNNLTLDATCYTYAQIGYLPAINPKNGKCITWFNDAALFDFNDIERIDAEVKEHINTATPNDYNTSNIDFNLIVKIVSTKVSHLHYHDLMCWAGAFQAISANYYHFQEFYTQVNDSTQTAQHIWNCALKGDVEKHAGRILQHLKRDEKVECGLATKKSLKSKQKGVLGESANQTDTRNLTQPEQVKPKTVEDLDGFYRGDTHLGLLMPTGAGKSVNTCDYIKAKVVKKSLAVSPQKRKERSSIKTIYFTKTTANSLEIYNNLKPNTAGLSWAEKQRVQSEWLLNKPVVVMGKSERNCDMMRSYKYEVARNPATPKPKFNRDLCKTCCFLHDCGYWGQSKEAAISKVVIANHHYFHQSNIIGHLFSSDYKIRNMEREAIIPKAIST